jgi:hypothetical protein
MNLVLITSIINISSNPLSYSNIRSVFNSEERFEQTKKTIESIKIFIPNSQIFLIECSDLSKYQIEYLKNNCDYFLNLFDNINEIIKNNILYSQSKSLGEGTQTIEALKYITQNNIKFDNLFKISGRYWLMDKFDYNIFNNNKIVIKKIDNDSVSTSFYKIPVNEMLILLNFLEYNIENMKQNIGYETLIAKYINSRSNIFYILFIGVEGYISVSRDYYLR